ncbi:MAG: hypothetical protein ACREHG_10650 [Candidatus Saccharimonadales bacterium]
MKELNVYPAAGQTEVVVREGAAFVIRDPVKIKQNGTIGSIGEFLSKRRDSGGSGLQAIDRTRAIVVVDREKLSIALLLDPENVFGTEIGGSLEISDDLKPFHINEDVHFTREQLVKLFRFNRLLFHDRDNHTALLAAYQSFKAKTKADMDAESDTRGNKKFGFQKDVTTNLPEDFILKVPIFKGESEVVFRVEVCLDITDGGAMFWFESVELKELQDKLRDKLIDAQLAFCADFPIIQK